MKTFNVIYLLTFLILVSCQTKTSDVTEIAIEPTKIGFEVAAKVNDGHKTLSFFLTPAIIRARCIAAVAEDNAAESFTFKYLEISFSNSST